MEKRCRGTNTIRVTRLEIHWYSGAKRTTDSVPPPSLLPALLDRFVSFLVHLPVHLPLRAKVVFVNFCFCRASKRYRRPTSNPWPTWRWTDRCFGSTDNDKSGKREMARGGMAMSRSRNRKRRDQLRWNVNGESSETKEEESAARNAWKRVASGVKDLPAVKLKQTRCSFESHFVKKSIETFVNIR